MGSYDAYKKLTKAEQDFVKSHPLAAMTFKEDAAKALLEAQNRFPKETLHNGQGDAFRHAYWNALMVKHENYALAKEFADAHETAPGQPAAEMDMDLYNNREGRLIAYNNPNATEEELAKLVEKAVQDGKLRTLK
ncbi:MAG: hypothetical protein K1X72_03695 [Pyrinomonadaceae bacterium]|nr:hypothetical protein [Pyrinomonadaceae bacterium]